MRKGLKRPAGIKVSAVKKSQLIRLWIVIVRSSFQAFCIKGKILHWHVSGTYFKSGWFLIKAI